MLKLPRGGIEVKEGDSETLLKAENVKPQGEGGDEWISCERPFT
jgi:hypothetical protein